MEIGFWRARQERTPETALSPLPQDRVKVSAHLAGIAVPAQGLERNFQYGSPTARQDVRARDQAQIDAFEMLPCADDPDLKGLIVRRDFELEIGKAARRERHEQFPDIELVRIFVLAQNLLRVQ